MATPADEQLGEQPDERVDAVAKAELDARGYTIIERLLSPLQVAAALAALERLFGDGHAEDQHKDIMYTMNLTARDQIFREVTWDFHGELAQFSSVGPTV